MNNHAAPYLRTSSGEPIIERTFTFRQSTFNAIKVFMREHHEATGEVRTNAAIVDWLLRCELGRRGPAVREAMYQNNPPLPVRLEQERGL
ncbi:MAG: hypothetical protein IPG98_15115 [Burkholderiales bacterium]|nr:hypothetical protein [Burkholderiales bacterium]MBK8667076.1 hypothetical protein [Burkholderiales bacterium]